MVADEASLLDGVTDWRLRSRSWILPLRWRVVATAADVARAFACLEADCPEPLRRALSRARGNGSRCGRVRAQACDRNRHARCGRRRAQRPLVHFTGRSRFAPAGKSTRRRRSDESRLPRTRGRAALGRFSSDNPVDFARSRRRSGDVGFLWQETIQRRRLRWERKVPQARPSPRAAGRRATVTLSKQVRGRRGGGAPGRALGKGLCAGDEKAPCGAGQAAGVGQAQGAQGVHRLRGPRRRRQGRHDQGDHRAGEPAGVSRRCAHCAHRAREVPDVPTALSAAHAGCRRGRDLRP